MNITENGKTTKVLNSCEVLVAGGGVAGIAAAIAAAREGASVLLVEKACILGGLATSGLVTIYLPLCDGAGHQMSYGLAQELLLLSIKHGAQDRNPDAWLSPNGDLEQRVKNRYMVQFNPYFFALEAEKLLLNLGVRILYDTLICDAVVNEDKITHIIVENKSGRSAIAVKTVVDTSGDADVCAMSTEKTAQYAPGNFCSSWYYSFSQSEGYRLRMLGVQAAQGLLPSSEGESSYTGIDGIKNSEMILSCHKALMLDIEKHREGDSTYEPVSIATMPLFRMTRRLDGVVVLDDKNDGGFVSDSIGSVGDWRKRGPRFEIPYRCLYGEKIKNLITAGRCISVTDDMWDITRVIPVCAVTGEAAGTAAALTDCFSQLDVSALQKRLEGHGAVMHCQFD